MLQQRAASREPARATAAVMPITRTLKAPPVERGATALVLEPALKVAGALLAGLTVAVAMVLDAKVMLLEEPTTGTVLLA